MNTKETKNALSQEYTISKETTHFLNAIRLYQAARSEYLNGWDSVVGGDETNDTFNKEYETFKAVETLLYAGLNASISENMGTINNTEI